MKAFLTAEPIQPTPSKDYPETIDNRAILKELETLQQRIQETPVADIEEKQLNSSISPGESS